MSWFKSQADLERDIATTVAPVSTSTILKVLKGVNITCWELQPKQYSFHPDVITAIINDSIVKISHKSGYCANTGESETVVEVSGRVITEEKIEWKCYNNGKRQTIPSNSLGYFINDLIKQLVKCKEKNVIEICHKLRKYQPDEWTLSQERVDLSKVNRLFRDSISTTNYLGTSVIIVRERSNYSVTGYDERTVCHTKYEYILSIDDIEVGKEACTNDGGEPTRGPIGQVFESVFVVLYAPIEQEDMQRRQLLINEKIEQQRQIDMDLHVKSEENRNLINRL